MAWTKMSTVPNPVMDSNGDVASGYVLKCYLPGTTTATSIATDSSGGTTVASMTTNAAGVWETSGNEVVPHIDRKVKWGIFQNSTHAAANTPFAIGPFDNVEQSSSTQSDNPTPAFIETQLGSAAVSRVFTLTLFAYQVGATNTANLMVFRNGQKLTKGVTADYTETSTTTVTLTFDPNDNDSFDFIASTSVATAVADSSTITYTPVGTGAVATDVQTKLREVVSVKDFGALGDGTTDDTAAIQLAMDHITGRDELDWAYELVFPAGNYKVSGVINVPGENIHIRGLGVARIETLNPQVSDTYAIFDINSVAYNVTIEGLTFYLAGTRCTAITADQLYRQVRFTNIAVVGGDGFDLIQTSSDKWQVHIDNCRFNDCQTGVEWDVGGQTAKVSDTLFFNCAVIDMNLQDGSQVIIDNVVFENAGTSKCPALSVTNVKELKMIGVQGERLGVDSGDTGVKADYQFVFTDSTVDMDGCRLWGGSFGSVEPGNSRQYGVYLDNTSLTLRNTRIYSFRKIAMKMANDSACYTDLMSQVDFRCLGGDPNFFCTANLGENLIVEGDFRRWDDASSKPRPLGWTRASETGTPARATTNLLENTTQGGIDNTSMSVNYYSNYFPVAVGEWITVRLSARGTLTNVYLHKQDGTSFFQYDTGGSRVTFGSTNDPQDATRADDHALIVFTAQVPAGVTNCRISLPDDGIYVESVAAYRGVKVNTTDPGTLYSDNDASYGCFVKLAPPIPFVPNTKLQTRVIASSSLRGDYLQGDRLHYINPSAGGDEGIICTTTGDGGGAAVFKTFGSITA